MTSKLDRIGALGLVQGTVKPPSATNKPDEKNTYHELNRLAYHEIIEHLDDSNLTYVSQMLTDQTAFNGYAVWTVLKQKYSGDNHVARDLALNTFLDIEYQSPPAKFIAEIRAANHRLVSAKVGLNEQRKTALILRKLPLAEYKSFRDVLNVGFPNDTVPLLLGQLEKHIAQNQLDRSSTITQATFLTTDEKYYMCPHCKRGFTICSHCDKAGHRESFCYEKHPERRPSSTSDSSSVKPITSKSKPVAQAHMAYASNPQGFTDEQIESERHFQEMLANPEFKKLCLHDCL
ncbi:hypothetical protein PTTG_10283 [Puccinia triticina 1-1 BBBD Race 1]|uniref:Uncharacterized protein n=1 Tax=Puccinia triticina (isolate 1-1 / race 1 (BBBD)) TaxID=630390 RepID=A0A0C4FAP0_PUCT1|nr:hypothetical protein PTTG_10283 [Puccinia triticina 1-1 BBBD Race 1]